MYESGVIEKAKNYALELGIKAFETLTKFEKQVENQDAYQKVLDICHSTIY
jgi:geranylgeranyl pyrophosphate synthase